MSIKIAAKTLLKIGCLSLIIIIALFILLITSVSRKSDNECKRIDTLPRLTAYLRADETVGFPFSNEQAIFGQLAGEYLILGSGGNNRTNHTSDITVNIIPESLKVELDGTVYPLAYNKKAYFDGFRIGESITIYKNDSEEERRNFSEAYRGLDPELDKAIQYLMDGKSRLHYITLRNYYFLDGDKVEFAGEIDGDMIRLLE